MLVDVSILKPRTKQILHRLSLNMSLPKVADSLGMKLQPVKNLLYKQRKNSGALSVGHLLLVWSRQYELPKEYEETCQYCGEHTSPYKAITRDPEGVFCSPACFDLFIGDYLLEAAGAVVEEDEGLAIALDKIEIGVVQSS